MTWKSLLYESVNLNDGLTHEIYLESHEMIEVKRDGESNQAHKYYGIENRVGPVAFLATDHLHGTIGDIPSVVRITWRGKKKIKGNRTFNVFAIQKWEGELPEWINGDFAATDIQPENDESVPF